MEFNQFPITGTTILKTTKTTAARDKDAIVIVQDGTTVHINIEDLFKYPGLKEMIDRMGAGNLRGAVKPSSAAPTGDFWVIAAEPGTYTNFNGTIVPANSLGVIARIGGVWTVTITELDTNAVKKTDLLENRIGNNLFNPISIVPARYIDPTTFAILITGGAAYIMSGKIPVKPLTTYRLNGFSGISYSIPLRYLNAANALISGEVPVGATVNVTTFTFTTPANCTQIEFTIKTGKTGDTTSPTNIMLSEGSEVVPFEEYKTAISKINDKEVVAAFGSEAEPVSPASVIVKGFFDKAIKGLRGKKVMFFGDSITADSTNAGAPNRTSWVTYFIEKTGCVRLNNYAFSGGSFTNWTWDTNARQMMSKQVEDAITSGLIPDVIIISMGTNDYFRKPLFGDYTTAMAKTTQASLDKTIVMEAARWAFWKLQEAFPNAVKYYGLPIQRASAIQEDGVWLRDGLTQMAKRYNFNVIDAHSESGIIKDFEVSGSPGRFLNDGLHPNNTGYELMADYYINKIRIKDQL